MFVIGLVVERCVPRLGGISEGCDRFDVKNVVAVDFKVFDVGYVCSFKYVLDVDGYLCAGLFGSFSYRVGVLNRYYICVRILFHRLLCRSVVVPFDHLVVCLDRCISGGEDAFFHCQIFLVLGVVRVILYFFFFVFCDGFVMGSDFLIVLLGLLFCLSGSFCLGVFTAVVLIDACFFRCVFFVDLRVGFFCRLNGFCVGLFRCPYAFCLCFVVLVDLGILAVCLFDRRLICLIDGPVVRFCVFVVFVYFPVVFFERLISVKPCLCRCRIRDLSRFGNHCLSDRRLGNDRLCDRGFGYGCVGCFLCRGFLWFFPDFVHFIHVVIGFCPGGAHVGGEDDSKRQDGGSESSRGPVSVLSVLHCG